LGTLRLLAPLCRASLSIILWFLEEFNGEVGDAEEGNDDEDVHVGVIEQKLEDGHQTDDLDESNHSHADPPHPTSVITIIPS
jgi:hypothetical protein